MFATSNRQLWEWLIILPLKSGKYIIKSYKDGLTLYLDSVGKTGFKEEKDHGSQQWDIEYKDGYYFFINPFTAGKVLQVQEGSDKLRCMATNKVKGP